MAADPHTPRLPTPLHEEARRVREEACRTIEAANIIAEHVRRVLRTACLDERFANCPSPARARGARFDRAGFRPN